MSYDVYLAMALFLSDLICPNAVCWPTVPSICHDVREVHLWSEIQDPALSHAVGLGLYGPRYRKRGKVETLGKVAERNNK